MSPPSRAAWIEISCVSAYVFAAASRRLHGRRGLKLNLLHCRSICASRRLHGRRGLKFRKPFVVFFRFPSPPSRAAWIEILKKRYKERFFGSPPSRAAWIEILFFIAQPLIKFWSPPSRAAWIEIISTEVKHNVTSSPPSRAAWIEMHVLRPPPVSVWVAAFTGGVD